MDGTLYKPDGAVVLQVSDDSPEFGQIKAVHIIDNCVVLYVQLMSTSHFIEHYHAYIVEYTSHYVPVIVSDLFSPFPLCIRRILINDSTSLCIVPRFHIVGTLK